MYKGIQGTAAFPYNIDTDCATISGLLACAGIMASVLGNSDPVAQASKLLASIEQQVELNLTFELLPGVEDLTIRVKDNMVHHGDINRAGATLKRARRQNS